MLVAPMVVLSAVTAYGVPASGAVVARSVTLSVRSAHSEPEGAAGMLIEKVLGRLPVLAMVMTPVVPPHVELTAFTVITALHQPLPAPTGIVPISETQLVLLACARVPAATLLPAFSVYAFQAARPPKLTRAVPATAAPRMSATRRERLLCRFSMILVSLVAVLTATPSSSNALDVTGKARGEMARSPGRSRHSRVTGFQAGVT